MDRREPSRRALMAGATLAGLGTVAGSMSWRASRVSEPSYGIGVGITPTGQRQILTDGWWPGPTPTRVLGDSNDPAVQRARAAEAAWLAAATVPGAGTRWHDLAVGALLDLRVLTLAPGRLVAGYAPSWRYVWPRDAAFGAAALAAVGLLDDAVHVLDFLQQVSEPVSGQFHARYRPDDARPPDGRGVQLDSNGWALWASDRVIAAAPPQQQKQLLTTLDPLIQQSRRAIVDGIDPRTGLPIATPDYWEVPERTATLGTVAAQLAGLRAAVRLAQRAGNEHAAADVDARANDLRAALDDTFAPDYPRHSHRDDPDASVTFLTAPIGSEQIPQAPRLRAECAQRAARTAGGLAPGAGWKRDGVSWTPATALFALAAAGAGERRVAAHWLDWLMAHRTTRGSLPEKVNHDGSPGGPAPLAWSGALVLLTLAELDRP